MMINDKILFITGGVGFIATNLIKRLVDVNKIVVYDNFSRNALKDSGYWKHPNLKVVHGDILDYDLLIDSIPNDVDLICHMAAVAGIDTVIKNPVKTMEVNMIGTYNMLRSIQELGLSKRIKRFVEFSTSEVFGINAFRVDEKTPANMQPIGEARWTYAVSKHAGEHLTHSFEKQYGLPAITVRPFNIYGPGQVGEGAIHHFVLRALNNENLIIHGDGDQIRSWCYIDDMVDGLLLCLESEGVVGEVFNIGNPRGTTTILQLAEKVIQLVGSGSEIVHIPKRYADVELRIPNIDKAVERLNFSPKIDLNEGIRNTIEWYKSRV